MQNVRKCKRSIVYCNHDWMILNAVAGPWNGLPSRPTIRKSFVMITIINLTINITKLLKNKEMELLKSKVAQQTIHIDKLARTNVSLF
jgi:hypothetical protein